MRLRDKIFAGTLTGVVAATVITAAFLPSSPAYAEYVVDFTQGDYSVWDGISYTFDWYETPTEVDGVTTYTIASASDLAGFCVLTNNLSASEFSNITSNVAVEDADYIAQVDTFEDAVVKLDCNIDLANFDWMPISYPWATANLSASYDIHTPEGTVVHYNGVDYIPDDTVDPWVGDENGDPISTRYWEYPESELRFRDLMHAVNFDSTRMAWDNIQYTDLPGYYALVPRDKVGGDDYADILKVPEETRPALDILAFKSNYVVKDKYDVAVMYPYTLKNIVGYTETTGFAGVFDGNMKNIKGLHPETPWTDDAMTRLNTYDPLAKGLFGMLSENGVIKNLNVKGSYTDDVVSYSAILCAYNYGTIDTCYVDGEMKQALVEMIYPINKDYVPHGQSSYRLSMEAGTVMPLGNSGFMTSQNYGTIKNSYTVGEATQVFRQFGFFASSNYGTIQDCQNRASVSSVFVETDFTTAEWSYATEEELKSMDRPVEYTWQSTWGLKSNLYFLNNKFSRLWGYGYVDTDKRLHHLIETSATATEEDMLPFTNIAALANAYSASVLVPPVLDKQIDLGEINDRTDERYYNGNLYGHMPYTNIERAMGASAVHYATDVLCKAKYGDDSYTLFSWEDWLWTPAIWEATEGESVAANQLYGVYTMTAVGGIAAVNHGVIADSNNKGIVSTIYGTSPRNNFHTYIEIEDEAQQPKDYYSYIRPTNTYGLFATARDTYSLAGGIIALNMNKVQGCINNGTILERDLTDAEKYTYHNANSAEDAVEHQTSLMYWKQYLVDGIRLVQPTVYVENVGAIDFIVASKNGWYQQNSKIEWNGEEHYTAYNLDWWVTTEDDVNIIKAAATAAEEEYNADLFYDIDTYVLNRNMPYPFVSTTNVESRQRSGGIVAINAAELSDNENRGAAKHGICELSAGTDDEKASLSRNKVNSTDAIESNGFDIAYKTDIELNSTMLTNTDLPALGNLIYTDTDTIDVAANTVYSGKSMFKSVWSTDGTRVYVEDNAIYDTINTGAGIAETLENCDVINLVNTQNSINGVAKLTNCSLKNVYIYGDNTNGIGEGTVTIGENLIYGGLNCDWSVGFLKPIADERLVLKNVQVLALDSDGALGKARKGIGEFEGCDIEDCTIFTNFTNHLWNAKNSTFNNVTFVGDSDEITDDSGYVFLFDACTAKDMYLQPKVNLLWEDYGRTFNLKHIPGMLKLTHDTNVFENCVIQVPDGALSFSTYNIGFVDDTTIQTDMIMCYDIDARSSGALAYYLDNGKSSARTNEYTVAFNDVVRLIPADTAFVEYDELSERITCEPIALPAYTRKIKDAAREHSYYAVYIPHNGNGAGYLQGTMTRGDITYTTSTTDAVFPKTVLYVQTGDTVDVTAQINQGFALIGVQEAVGSEIIDVELRDDVPIYTLYAGTSDVTLLGVWSDVYDVEVDENDWCQIVANCTGAAYNESVHVQLQTLTDDFVISRVYYCPYALDENNREVLDLSTEVDIDMNTLEFKMPKSSVRIFAEQSSTANNITEFVLAGQRGVIDNAASTISFTFADSIDLTNAIPDSIQVSDGCEVSPAVDIPQDFTKPVVYEVTAPSGDVRRYTVSVTLKKDGEITEFSLLQYKGIIAEDGTITITLPKTVDVTACVPTVVWSGLDITPDITQPQDFTQAVSYTVTASDGTQKTYTIAVTFIETDAPVGVLQIDTADGVPLQVDIDYALKCITITYPYGTDVSELNITGVGFDGTTSLIAGDKLNLTKYNCLVVSNGGDTAAFDIIGVEKPLDVKRITQFRIYGHDAVINEETHSIAVTLPAKYDITNIAPDAVGFIGKSITDISVRHDFTQPVIYTVTAADGTTVDYTVTIVKGDN